jgi:ABC-type nitrate/sulfonate/bicarbonate transport system permease component
VRPDVGTRPYAHTERLSGIVFAAILLTSWELANRTGLVDRLILPAPSEIVLTLIRSLLGQGQAAYPIAANTLASLRMLVTGFVLGAILGVACGLLTGMSNTAHRIASPILGLMVPVPAIAWAPICMVWFGLGAPTIIAIVTYACFSEVIYNTAAGVRGTPVRFLWVADSFSAGPFMRLRHVVLPAAFPQIFVGLKLGLGASWRALIGAEMFSGVSAGLGFMLYQAHEFYATDVMFASLLVVALFSLLIEQVGLRFIEQRTLGRWGMSQVLEI